MKTKAEKDNHSAIQNPNNPAFWKCRGFRDRPDDWWGRVKPEGLSLAKPDGNRANQLNPSSELYSKSRRLEARQESGKKD